MDVEGSDEFKCELSIRPNNSPDDQTWYFGTHILDNYYIDSETLEDGTHEWGIADIKDFKKPEKQPEKKPDAEIKHEDKKVPSADDIYRAKISKKVQNKFFEGLFKTMLHKDLNHDLVECLYNPFKLVDEYNDLSDKYIGKNFMKIFGSVFNFGFYMDYFKIMLKTVTHGLSVMDGCQGISKEVDALKLKWLHLINPLTFISALPKLFTGLGDVMNFSNQYM